MEWARERWRSAPARKVVEAQAMLDLLARTYPIFAEWREAEVDTALLRGYMGTNYGWTIHVTNNTKPTALTNFPMQAHGAEMLRIACCLAIERGVQVIAPVHDALMIESSVDQIEAAIRITRGAMAEAAAAVIGTGVWIDTDVNITSYPDRYRDSDDRGQAMWERANSLLGRLDKIPGYRTRRISIRLFDLSIRRSIWHVAYQSTYKR
jgi:hypothetical protein